MALRDRWRRAQAPSERAHDFTKLTCALFFRAVWDKIATV
ncbi:hypothetical protein SAMN05421539_10346 [Jannaschia seohaensis]|uniref:Uncharacterized protein n=1 Tax=Jannaschia seohaensis TaxID=475081 RepID=A0A2Y9AID3_9RHOB|nr:hypothetical protein BCF38_10346 [Jannaschia seohaensis]SSA44231.1 hypothetical protein SAMN05421539_10346 [Jannaschia seohaensis]